jgi:hypothetical protein
MSPRAQMFARAILTALVATGCASGVQVPVQRLPEADVMRFHCGIDTRQRLVIRDQAAWTAEWSRLASGYLPVIPPVPAVDFTSNAIVVATMGDRPSSGYAIEVTEMRLDGEDASISVIEDSPSSTCVVLAELTDPVAVVRVPAFSGHATFVEDTSQHDCR